MTNFNDNGLCECDNLELQKVNGGSLLVAALFFAPVVIGFAIAICLIKRRREKEHLMTPKIIGK